MAIWTKPYTLDDIHKRGKGTLAEHLGIVFTEISDTFVRGTMPVDHRTKQPAGMLHGGASVALAETLASVAANMTTDPAEEMCVGLEINANHIRSVSDGIVTGTASPLHLGKTTQVWEIKMEQNGKLTCVSRITVAKLKKKS